MGYIAFLDLLGTKDFCGNPEVYNTNISIFYQEAQNHSYRLAEGRVGIFSDCLYAESKNLREILDFLVSLRKRLCSRALFFSAALTKGHIDIVNPARSEKGNFFGVAFENSDIADVYIKQNRFKGIGIWVDESVQAEMKSISKYRLVKSVYLEEVDTTSYSPYYDIAYDLNNLVYNNYEESLIKTILNECLLAYTKSKRYGRYYLSILATLLNSYTDFELSWNLKKADFDKCPLLYSIVMKLAEDNGMMYPIVQGIEFLCLLIIDNVFSHNEITDIDRRWIVKKFMSYECLKKPYSYAINTLPNVFSPLHRDMFIQIYQGNIVRTQVEDLIMKSEE